MTLTETYEYLQRPRKLELSIMRLSLQHDELQACLLPAAIRYDKDVVQTSPEDKLSEVAAAVLDLEKKIQRLRSQKARLLLEINAAIDKLDDKDAVILTAYYVKRMTMSDVADIIDKSLQHTYRLRKKAVQHLSELM
jgi:DNA-directed RNA polymerase specialized sigma subunit